MIKITDYIGGGATRGAGSLVGPGHRGSQHSNQGRAHASNMGCYGDADRLGTHKEPRTLQRGRCHAAGRGELCPSSAAGAASGAAPSPQSAEAATVLRPL